MYIIVIKQIYHSIVRQEALHMISPHVVALAEAGALPDVTGVLILFALPGAGAGSLSPAGAQVPELAAGQAGAEDRAEVGPLGLGATALAPPHLGGAVLRLDPR